MKTLYTLFLFSLFLSTNSFAQKAVKRPNIVIVLVDDMGVMDTSVALMKDEKGQPQRHPHNDFFVTPNMERLAQQGKAFSDFYAMSVCSPSRTSLLTGQNSARHHTTQWINPYGNNRGKFGPKGWNWTGISAEDKTIVTELKKAGYYTIHAGKAHFGPKGYLAEKPDQIGFDVNIGGSAIGQPGSYYGKNNYGKGGYHPVPGLEQYHGTDTFLTEATTLEMKKEITKSVQDGKPFFAYMSHYALHAPFHMDKRFENLYSEKCKKLGYKGSEKAFGTLVTGMDKSLGDLMDHLEKLKVAENTLIIFLGDNGTDFRVKADKRGVGPAAPLRSFKGSKYEGGMRVPAIFAWGKNNKNNKFQRRSPIKAGLITDRFRNICDIFPTVLNIAGLSKKDLTLDGISLRKLLANKAKKAVEDDFLMHFPHQHRSSYYTIYRHGDWKLIYNYHAPKTTQVELYNLKEDLSEQNNLAQQQPKRVKEMMKKMNMKLAEQKAQFPLSKENKEELKPKL